MESEKRAKKSKRFAVSQLGKYSLFNNHFIHDKSIAEDQLTRYERPKTFYLSHAPRAPSLRRVQEQRVNRSYYSASVYHQYEEPLLGRSIHSKRVLNVKIMLKRVNRPRIHKTLRPQRFDLISSFEKQKDSLYKQDNTQNRAPNKKKKSKLIILKNMPLKIGRRCGKCKNNLGIFYKKILL